MLVGETLKAQIDAWAQTLNATSGLAKAARNGELAPRALALYLESLRYVFECSQRNLTLAAGSAERLGLQDLASYFGEKAHEERGHDRWALSDLSKLPAEITRGVQPAPASVRLTELQRTLIAQHPLCYAAYALWAEYFTVLLGEEWLENLAKSGYPRSNLSAIANHIEADREHAARGFVEIDRLWCGQPNAAVLVESVERAQRLFEQFCDEICLEARRAA